MATEELIERYERAGRRTAADGTAGLPAPPAQHVAVLTCMDARIDPAVLFGLAPGDAHVLRNAGGVVTDDVLRSLVISQRKLGTRDVLLVRHAGCGLTTFTDDEFAAELAADVGSGPSWRGHAFDDPAAGVRGDMELLRRDPFLLPGTRLRGFVLDLDDCRLQEIAA